jgi:hypothetical protein
MGQAVLQIHQHEGKEYVPEGFWCSAQGNDGLLSGDLVMFLALARPHSAAVEVKQLDYKMMSL